MKHDSQPTFGCMWLCAAWLVMLAAIIVAAIVFNY